jgi:hypothetical protein
MRDCATARLRDCATAHLPALTCDYDDECDEKKTGRDDQNQQTVRENGFQTCVIEAPFDQDISLKEPKPFRRRS